MAIGKSHEFKFYAYWSPEEETVQLRQIGSLRPPNEAINLAVQLIDNANIEYDTTESELLRLGSVTVVFIQVPGEPDKNTIDKSQSSFEKDVRTETGTPVGDEVAGEYQRRNSVYDDNPKNMYAPYQHKGWMTVNGEYYTPDDEKPEGWSS